MRRCSILLKKKVIEVRFHLELWHYHFTKHFQMFVVLNNNIKCTACNFKADKKYFNNCKPTFGPPCISNNMKFEKCYTQYCLFNSESICLNVSNIKNYNNFIFGVIYRHPTTTDVDKFLDDLSDYLTNLSAPKKHFT